MKQEFEVLRRLGPVPYWRGERKCMDALESVYRAAQAKANALLHREEVAAAAPKSAFTVRGKKR